MNKSDKPKPAKLWRQHGTGSKKHKKFKPDGNMSRIGPTKKNDTDSADGQSFKQKPRKFKKKFAAKNDSSENQRGEKRKIESSADTPNKKFKPGGTMRKDVKMQHKKNSGDKTEVKLENMKKKDRKLYREKKEAKGDKFEVGKSLKTIWEDLRQESCTPEKKSQLLKQACDMLKGRIKEFTFAHDTVRVLQCIFALGAETHRSLIFEELKGDILPLTKSKYAKFIVIKMLKYGTKQNKEFIMKAFHGKVISLIRHTEAADVVEVAFNEYTNAAQRFELVQEFYGASYKFFKESDVHSLKELLEKCPEKKNEIIRNMKIELLKVLNKSVAKHSIVHHVLWQFMCHSDPSSKSEVIEALREIVPEILHSKDGSRVAMHCVWYGALKDRKVIVKSMKTFVSKIAMEEHGHMVLLALFDSFDDTIFLSKHVIKELLKSSLELSQHVHGKKVLIYLLSPRDPHHFHPDIINILKMGDDNAISKKDPEIRRSELKSMVSGPLLELIKQNIQNLYTNNGFCRFTLTILDHTAGHRKEALTAIADLTVEPYTVENKNTHVIEHPGSNFLLKQLIVKNFKEDEMTFSEILMNSVPKLVARSWIECNRGAFLLVSLIETLVPSVVERVKEELSGCKTYLAKKPYTAAEILLKKLKV